MIRAFLEKRRIKRIFGKCVAPETVESLLSGGAPDQPLKQGRIEFVLVFVRGRDPVQVSERIARVVDLAVRHGAMVQNLIGALAIVTFGTHRGSSPEPSNRSALVQAFRDQLAGEIKIVHGAGDGHYGVFGSEAGMSYTFLVPQFDRILGVLSRLEFGETEEFLPS